VKLNLTPDPKILVALTATPLDPLDALCELIDNAIDSFTDARLRGQPVQYPLVVVQIPGQAEIRRDGGALIVRDNGTGLSLEGAQKALTAGYSGKAARGGTLGLFGMGFNIASGKFGHRTRFVTALKNSPEAVQVVVDLNQMQAERSYEVPADLIPKAADFSHGTVVEISGWWPDGSPNHAFIRKLAGYTPVTIAKELSRRYATILREHDVRIQVNQEVCTAFEHCVWDRSRYIERRGLGKVPARLEFNEVLLTQTRCASCDTLFLEGQTTCPDCGSVAIRSVAERVRGWIGIQRYDDGTEFGIDLIRNGRTIRIGEKDAFFTYVDEFKRELKDYPIDSPYGRIVGEVHLDHVPVDFLKQNFERSSSEWRRAIAFLRGESSLQPTKPNADKNTSPVFQLYQAYRKVRSFGKTDMYMGTWDPLEEKAKRIGREVEKEYLRRFNEREPGFYDDIEWWKLVESADQPPPPRLIECPGCGAENLPDTEVCQVCSHVLVGQPCINKACGKSIPASATTCPECGASQVPEVVRPWQCAVCGETNSERTEICGTCSRPRGALNPASAEHLIANSTKDDSLSVVGLSVVLADGSHTQPIDLDVYNSASPIVPSWQGNPVPVLTIKSDRIQVFLDRAHTVFRSYRIRPEVLAACDIAQYLYDLNRAVLQRPNAKGIHAVSHLTWQVVSKYWSEMLEDSSEQVRADIELFFADLREALPRLTAGISVDLFSALTEDDQRALTNNMLAQGQDLLKLGEWSRNGDFLRFADQATIVRLFRSHPQLFFDGGVWNVPYTAIPGGLQDSVIQHIQKEVRAQYLNCLEDCAAYLRYSKPDHAVTQRARMSLLFLEQRAV
jgi:hypothetical protein